MTRTDEVARVISRDGTPIGFWSSGTGDPLVLVHGTSGDATRWAPLRPYLERHATLYGMDRRGRGSSGDAEAYDIQREFEDIAVVVDAVAERSGTPVNLYGHSYGALCSIGASTLTTNINKLVLYEPVVSGEEATSPDLADQMDRLLAEGKREAIVEILFRDVLGMDPDELAAFKSAPSWQGRIDAAHTVAREFRAEMGGLFDRLDVESISVPTLLLKGELSPDWLRADTDRVAARLPDVRVVELEGQEHVADVMAPELFAGHVLTFLSDG